MKKREPLDVPWFASCFEFEITSRQYRFRVSCDSTIQGAATEAEDVFL